MAMSVVYANIGGRINCECRNGTVSHYAPDCQGSTIAQMNESGTVTDTYDYWSYGEERVHTGLGVSPFTFIGVLGYVKDVLNELYYVRARYYKPGLGVSQTLDALWPDEQAYGYCTQRPVLSVDPSGRRGCPGSQPCSSLITGLDASEEVNNLIKCCFNNPSKQGLEDCLDKFGDSITDKAWDAIKEYLACELASMTDPATNGGHLNPCEPPDGHPQSCCYMKFLKCLFDCTNKRGSKFSLCTASCKGKFEECGFAVAFGEADTASMRI